MSFQNYGYGVGYGTNPYFQSYQQPFQQNQFINRQQPIQNIDNQIRTVPFSEVLYGTLEQAKSQIVFPRQSVLFINPEKKEAYVSSSDQDGKPSFKTYEFYESGELSKEQQTSHSESVFSVKPDDLKEFLTSKDIEGFIKRKDLDDLYAKIEQLQKKIKINSIIEEER